MENERLARVEEKVGEMKEDLAEIKADLKALVKSHAFFRGKVMGVCIIISALIGLGIEIAKAKF